jgi:hypothetical protein
MGREMPATLAARVKALGWLEIDRERIDRVFPPQETGASQSEQIQSWCIIYGFDYEWNPVMDRLRVFRVV